jgi:hypothetical protein
VAVAKYLNALKVRERGGEYFIAGVNGAITLISTVYHCVSPAGRREFGCGHPAAEFISIARAKWPPVVKTRGNNVRQNFLRALR